MLRVVSYGGGVNSTALLVGLHERGEWPDLVLFSDTGDEFDETYAFIDTLDAWTAERGYAPVERIRRVTGKYDTLEHECLGNGTLPSLAFGFKGCSVKWKRQPMDRWLRSWPPALEAWERGEKVARLLGIDAGEPWRGMVPDCERFSYERPLVDWKWDRADCVAAIERAGLPPPRKSSCWYCPASTKSEVLELSRTRPDLFARAAAMEANADESLGTTKGLGRQFSWRALAAADAAQLKLFPEIGVTQDCGCHDEYDDAGTPEARDAEA